MGHPELFFSLKIIGVRPMGLGGGGGGSSPLEFFGQKSGTIRDKPLDYRASNGKNIRARDFSPPNKTRPVLCLKY